MLHGLADETIEDLLGLNREEDFAGAEREHPDAVLAVWPTDPAEAGPTRTQRVIPRAPRSGPRTRTDSGGWHGAANRLSRDDPVRWKVIDEVAARNAQADRRGARVRSA